MPKRVTRPEAAAAAEGPNSRAAKSRNAAAAHKHAPKKAAEPVPATPEARPARIVPREETALRAYSYWEQRGYTGGSAEEDWLRAERELAELA